MAVFLIILSILLVVNIVLLVFSVNNISYHKPNILKRKTMVRQTRQPLQLSNYTEDLKKAV